MSAMADNRDDSNGAVTFVAQELSDTDLSSLAMGNSDQFMSSDYETLASIEAQLECMNAEEVMATDEGPIINETIESESVLPDVEMTEVSDDIHGDEIIYGTDNQSVANLIMETKPSIQMVSSTPSAQSNTTVTSSGQTQSIMIVSPAGGGGASQILKISHPASASADQLQTIAQSLITGKSPDGSLLQMRQTIPSTKLPIAPKSSNMTSSGTQKMKTVTTGGGKRVAQNSQQNRNVLTKMVLANPASQGSQQVLIASPSSDGQIGQTIKLLSSTASTLGSPTKITFAQAQQMGLIPTSPNKIQHILPSTVNKQAGLVMNKMYQSTTAQPAKLSLYSSVPKSPTKILPAPPVSGQARSSTSQSISLSSTNKIMQQNAQKVIIRQNSFKSAAIGSSPIIRIPGNQTITSNQIHSIQVPGRQVQYVRFVNTPPATTTNVMTVGKSKTPVSLQTANVTQKSNNQQQVLKVMPINSNSSQPLRNVAPKLPSTSAGQRLIIPASTTIGAHSNTLTIPASALSQFTSGQAVFTGNSNIVVLPPQYLQQQAEEVGSITPRPLPSTAVLNTSQGSQSSLNLSGGSSESRASKSFNSDANGIRPRKPCNCTKSQCLKLYCDCFANGEFCHMCNCNNCSNNLDNEEERQRAIRSCLERNPNAFRPKIGKGRDTGEDIRRHNKGCNCKRSGCLKNYCECYEAKIPCSDNCKCVGCRNTEEPLDKKLLKELTDAVEVRTQMNLNKSKMPRFHDTTFRPPALSNTGSRQPFNFLTDKVVEMTCQCLIAQAEEAERNMFDDEASQKLIIEEFGRCLKEIIESAHKAEAT